MAAQAPSLQSPRHLLNLISEEPPQLTFDIRAGGWTLRAKVRGKVCREITEIAGREIENIAVRAVKGAAFGMAAATLKWFFTPNPPIGVLDSIKNWFGVPLPAPSSWIQATLSGAAGGASVSALKNAYYIAVSLVEPKRNERLSKKMNRIMKALFHQVSQGESITCFLSRDIFQIPVKTNCTSDLPAHIFELSHLKYRIEKEKNSICPFPGCGREISSDKFTFAAGKRSQVSAIVKKALGWLASQSTEEKSDNLIKQEVSLEDEESIIRAIQQKSLSGKTLQSVSSIVVASVNRYNARIDHTYRAISSRIAADEKYLSIESIEALRRCLGIWRSSSRIELTNQTI